MATPRKYRRSTDQDVVAQEVEDYISNGFGYNNLSSPMSNYTLERPWKQNSSFRVNRKIFDQNPHRSSPTSSPLSSNASSLSSPYYRRENDWNQYNYSSPHFYSDSMNNANRSDRTPTKSSVNMNSEPSASSQGPSGWFELDMSGIGLRFLSASLSNFSHITALYLSNNRLSVLPDEVFSELKSLTTLDLAYNLFNRFPFIITQLTNLERLYLQDNRINELPVELGRLWKLKELRIEANPIVSPPLAVTQNGVEFTIAYLRDQMPMTSVQPERRFISYISDNKEGTTNGAESNNRIRVMSYNILSETYATPELYFFCPSWALDWDYRKQGILKELLSYDCDILCLQEVEGGAFNEFFEPEMSNAGYAGHITTKSRARTMEDRSIVDGCAVFYKKNKFSLVEEHSIEYQSIALSKHKDFSEEAFSRVITKDNVASVLILKLLEDTPLSFNPSSKPKHIMVGNTHIHWNPENKDVKLVQVNMLLEQIASILSPNRQNSKWSKIPMIICGDFNSIVDSGPYELLSNGKLQPNHPDLQPYHYGSLTTQGAKHDFSLSSAYAPVGEPPFTNYTGDFVGVLDYLWFTQESLTVSKVLQPVEEETIKLTKLPNAYMNSDHISLVAEFLFSNSKN